MINAQPPQPLRPYQTAAVVQVFNAWNSGKRRVLLVSPTGSGKTRMAEEFVWRARQAHEHVLFIVHRRELLKQTAARLRLSLGALDVAIIAPGEELSLESPVQVATVQTLLARDLLPEASLVIFDEAHHYVAEDWQKLVSSYPTIRALGLTATPERQDGRALGDIFDELVVAAQYSELLKAGFIVPCRVYQPPDDYAGDGLAQEPLQAWQRYAENSKTFWFSRSVEAAYEDAEALNRLGVKAATIEHNTPKRERDEALERFSAGELQVLTNVYALTEGVDVPAARCCLLARGCQHITPFLQMAGRVLRPAQGKADAILVDLTGATLRHGLPTEDRIYSLDGEGIRRTSKTPVRSCLKCGATFPSYERKCPACGYEPPIEVKSVKIWDLELRAVFAGAETPSTAKEREYRRLRALAKSRNWSLYFIQKEYKKLFGELPIITDATLDEQRAEYLRLVKLQTERGFKPGFVGVRFKEMFGRWPTNEVKSVIVNARRAVDAAGGQDPSGLGSTERQVDSG